MWTSEFLRIGALPQNVKNTQAGSPLTEDYVLKAEDKNIVVSGKMVLCLYKLYNKAWKTLKQFLRIWSSRIRNKIAPTIKQGSLEGYMW